MKKRIVMAIATTLLGASLSACGGNVQSAQENPSESLTEAQETIQEARHTIDSGFVDYQKLCPNGEYWQSMRIEADTCQYCFIVVTEQPLEKHHEYRVEYYRCPDCDEYIVDNIEDENQIIFITDEGCGESTWHRYGFGIDTMEEGNWDVLPVVDVEYYPQYDKSDIFIKTYVDGIHVWTEDGDWRDCDRVSMEKNGSFEPEDWEIME